MNGFFLISGISIRIVSKVVITTVFLLVPFRKGVAQSKKPTTTDSLLYALTLEREELRDEYLAIQAEATRIGDGKTITEAIQNTSGMQSSIRNDILRLEDVILSSEGSREELEKIRREVAEHPIFTRDDLYSEVKEEVAEKFIETVLKKLPSGIAPTVLGVATLIADGIEYGHRWVNRWLDVRAINRLIKQNTFNIGDLYSVHKGLHVRLQREIKSEEYLRSLKKQYDEKVSSEAQLSSRINLLGTRAADRAITQRDKGDLPLLRVLGVWKGQVIRSAGDIWNGYVIIKASPGYNGVIGEDGAVNTITALQLTGNTFTAKPMNQEIKMTLNPDGNFMRGTWADGWNYSNTSPLPATLTRIRTVAMVVSVVRLSADRVQVEFMGRFLPTDPRIKGMGIVETEGPMHAINWSKTESGDGMRVEIQLNKGVAPGRKYIRLNGTRVPWELLAFNPTGG